MAYSFRKMFFILSTFTYTFFSWIFDLLLINSRSLVLEVSEAVFQRSSRPEVFCTEGAPKNFAKFTEKHFCQSLYFNKVADIKPATLTFVIFKNTFFYRATPMAASKVDFSSHQRNIVWEQKLNGKPTMK